jgi:hypothetical protein
LKQTTPIPKIPYPLVLVEWKDHYADDRTWVSGHEIENTPEYCFSVGWLYKEDDEGMSIIRDLDPNDPKGGTVGGVQYILKNCITKLITLRNGVKKREKRQTDPIR